MAFLTINGLDVTIKYGGKRNRKYIGAHGRSISGNYLTDNRGHKNEWKFTTTPMTQARANVLIQMLSNNTQHWTYNSNMVSDCGLSISNSVNNQNHLSSTAGDGDPQKIIYSAPATTGNVQHNGASLWAGRGMENLLSSDSADCENAPTGFVAAGTGASISANTDNYWQGSKSVELTGGSATSYVVTDATVSGTIVESDVVTYGCWVKSVSGNNDTYLDIQWVDGGGSTISTTNGGTFTNDPDEWRLVYATSTAPATTAAAKIRVGNAANDDLYADGFFCAVQPNLVWWVDGGVTSVQHNPRYSRPWGHHEGGISVSCWCNGSAAAEAATNDGVVCDFGIDVTNGWLLKFATTTEYVTAVHTYNNVVTNSVYSTALNFGEKHHLVAVLDVKNKMQYLYVDGTLRDSDAIATCIDPQNVSSFTVGSNAYDTASLDGWVDDLLVIPAPITATEVSALYNSGTAFNIDSLDLICSGDFTARSWVDCQAEITSVDYRGLTLSGTHHNNSVSVTFILREV
jgi:hypothetical protein